MTNNADANQVVAFQRDPNGTLDNPHSYGTDGRGSASSAATQWHPVCRELN